MNELKGCPFCGSKDVGGASGTVYCYGCGVETSRHPDTELACLSWNNRVKDDLTIDKCIEYLIENSDKIKNVQFGELNNICNLWDNSAFKP